MPKKSSARKDPQGASLSVPMLSQEVADTYDAMVKEKAKASKGFVADRKAKDHKAAVVLAMGESKIAQLPDGRILQRVAKSRKLGSKAAHTQSWEDLVATELAASGAAA